MIIGTVKIMVILFLMVVKNTTFWDIRCVMLRDVLLLFSGLKSKLRKQTSRIVDCNGLDIQLGCGT
jgi:hypothetical protein